MAGVFLFSLSTSIHCATVPAALEFNNKPIDSLCFSNDEGNSNQIDLRNCGLLKEHYITQGFDSDLLSKGYIGYKWQDPQLPDSNQGYSYYKFYKAKKGQFWIYSINNGGGTGQFTGVHLINRDTTNSVHIESLAGGDRCNGGIENVSEKKGNLSFAVNLTAYDFIALSKKLNPSIKAYDDLAACAACCVAQAYYETEPNQTPHLNYVDIKSTDDNEQMPDQGELQNCFNKLFASYVKKGTYQLKQPQVDEFVVEFNKTCVKSATAD